MPGTQKFAPFAIFKTLRAYRHLSSEAATPIFPAAHALSWLYLLNCDYLTLTEK
jgi:hypothetical protein